MPSPADDLATTGAALQQNQIHFCEDLKPPNTFSPQSRGRGTKDFPGRYESNTKKQGFHYTWGKQALKMSPDCAEFFINSIINDKLSLDLSVIAVRNQEPLAQKNPEALNCSIKVYGHPKLSRSAHFRLKFITTHLKAFAELEVTHKTK